MRKQQVSLADMKELNERFQYEFQRVLNNIFDLNTDAEKKRKIVIEMTIEPDEQRELFTMEFKTKSVLAPTKSLKSKFVMGRREDGTVGATEFVSDVPGQIDFNSYVPEEMEVMEERNKEIAIVNNINKISKIKQIFEEKREAIQ